MAFETSQIYTLVNNSVQQATGNTTLQAVDAASLVSLGNVVLSSADYTDAFLNELALRIGKTIISYRAYRNKLGDMVLDDFEYGAILQKLKIGMPQATADETTNLVNGQSIDPYIVSKPQVDQKLFYKRTPYDYFITIQRRWLKEAFLSETAMGSFINYIFGEVRNKLELSLENLGRTCLNNFMAEIATTENRVVNLVTDYNTARGTTLTAATCMADNSFLRYASAQIRNYSDYMTDMSVLYNDGSLERHTPKSDQRMRVLTEFETAMETEVQYAAFHEQYVGLIDFTKVNFWQSAQAPTAIMVKRASDNTEVSIANIVAFIHDRDALGIYKKQEEVLTTPINARGSYYNTFWHENQLWFNDLSENGIMFTLN